VKHPSSFVRKVQVAGSAGRESCPKLGLVRTLWPSESESGMYVSIDVQLKTQK